MKRFIKGCLLNILACLIVLLLVGGYISSRRCYVRNYFTVVGLNWTGGIGNFTTEDAMDKFGEPIRVESQPDARGKYQFIDLYYEGFVLCFMDAESYENAEFRILELTGSKYRVGWRGLHVGSTREQVIRAYEYANVSQISECAPGEGYSDFYTNVYYEYDENDIVTKIRICV